LKNVKINEFSLNEKLFKILKEAQAENI